MMRVGVPSLQESTLLSTVPPVFTSCRIHQLTRLLSFAVSMSMERLHWQDRLLLQELNVLSSSVPSRSMEKARILARHFLKVIRLCLKILTEYLNGRQSRVCAHWRSEE